MEIINHPIKPEKGKAWHLYMHPYFTKQASNVVSSYIEHFTNEGDVVLDPFSGTGVTAIEALVLRRKAIAIDLNPLACFITQQTVAQIDTELFLKEFVKIKDSVGSIIESYDNMTQEEIDNIDIIHWYPKGIRLPKNTDKGFDFVEQLWTKRQILGLSTLWHAISQIENVDIREQMKYVFSATITRVNLTFHDSYKVMPDNTFKKINGGSVSILTHYRYWIPDRIVETSVWKLFNNRFKLVKKAKEEWNNLTLGFNVKENFQVINSSVLEMEKHIAENSIDYIYTDPPYGGNIAYLDLSTMWNAWLGFDLDEKIRNEEIIEGGDLGKTQENYEELFAKSFESMSKVLKKEGWLSLVFAHKKLEFWNLIIDSNESNGMEFKGSVFQPTNNSSIHYKKNPTNVLCSQRIANFKKTHNKSNKEKPDDIKQYILNELERACIEQRGSAIDVLYQRVLDKLLNNNTIHEAKKKGYLNIFNILETSDLFYFDVDTNLYFVKNSDEKYEEYQKEYFKNRDELTLFVKSILIQKKGLRFDEIHKEIFEVYKDDKKFPIDRLNRDLQEILNEIAYKSKITKQWIFRTGEKIEIDFGEEIQSRLVRIINTTGSHSETIFRLVQIGKYLKFNCWIGKREQSVDEFQGEKFSDLSISQLPFQIDDEHLLKSISQIDVIWLDKLNNPVFAFEVEESTNVMTGLERFMNMLKYEHSTANKLFIVAPKSRKKKLSDVFKKSTYIGAPLYLENKVKLIYKEELYRFYNDNIDKDFKESAILKLQETIV